MGRSQGQHGAFGKSQDIQTVSLRQARINLDKHKRIQQMNAMRQKEEAAAKFRQEQQKVLERRKEADAEVQSMLALGAKTYKCESDVPQEVEKWENKIRDLIYGALHYMKQYQRQHGHRCVIQWNSDWQDTGVFRIALCKKG